MFEIIIIIIIYIFVILFILIGIYTCWLSSQDKAFDDLFPKSKREEYENKHKCQACDTTIPSHFIKFKHKHGWCDACLTDHYN